MPALRQLHGEKRNKKGERVHLCANEKCRYKVTVKNKEEQDE